MIAKTRVFIGSSSEGLKFAKTIKERIEEESKDYKVTLWNDGVFAANEYYLESLERALRSFDSAILIFTQDDVTKSKGKFFESPRDNVTFELGLFLGKLGRKKVFFTSTSDVKIPTDLNGIHIPKIQWSKEHKDQHKNATTVPTKLVEEAVSGALIHLAKVRNGPTENINRCYTIAWEGMEDPKLYKNAPQHLRPRDFLLVKGSLEHLPLLSYCRSEIRKGNRFGAIVCDIEFLDGYYKNNRIVERDYTDLIRGDGLNNKSSQYKLHDQLTWFLGNKTRIARDYLKLGMPIRFGFQEILIHRDRMKKSFINTIIKKHDKNILSYKDVDLRTLFNNLLNEECEIALWDVPQPTICLLSGLGQELSEKETVFSFWKKLFDPPVMTKNLRKSVDYLCSEEIKSKWRFVDVQATLRYNLINSASTGKDPGGIGVVLGAGTWALRPDDIYDKDENPTGKIMALIPNPGVLTWIDCAAIMKDDFALSHTVELIRHWLLDSVQLDISKSAGGLRACPVTFDAVNRILSGKNSHPSRKTLKHFIENPDKFTLRPAPRPEHRELWNDLKKKRAVEHKSEINYSYE